MRRTGIAVDELQPTDYMLSSINRQGRSFLAWWVCTPNGLLGRLSMPEDVEVGDATGCHRVIEHEDGEISVPAPGPGEPANSILVEGWVFGRRREPGEPLMSWHGYINHGVWQQIS